MARLDAIRQFGDRQALLEWLANREYPTDGRLALGQYVGAPESLEWLQLSGLKAFDYREKIGHFDSLVGRAVSQFLGSAERGLLYLNRDPHGRYVAIVMTKPDPQ